MINPQTQAWTKPTNPDFSNQNPLAWTEPRQQRLQVKDLCKGFLLPQVEVLFSFVSLYFLLFFWCKAGGDSSSMPSHENQVFKTQVVTVNMRLTYLKC